MSPGEVFGVVVTVSACLRAIGTVIYFDGFVGVVDRNASERRSAGAAVPALLWSHRCGWDELAVCSGGLGDVRGALNLGQDWASRWAATWRYVGDEVTCAVRDLGGMPATGCQPVRRFSWRRAQRHRAGLQFLVSTGRHHGFESLEEARLLLALDFAGDLVDVLAQPLRLRYVTNEGPREHIPDFLACARTGRWLIDVRPAARVGREDLVAFAASAEVASMLGWRYVVVTGWKPHVATTLDTLSAQRRALTDRLGMVDELLTAVAAGPRPFGELAARSVAPAVARAYLLHLLWHRRLGVELGRPLGDASLVCAGGGRTW